MKETIYRCDICGLIILHKKAKAIENMEDCWVWKPTFIKWLWQRFMMMFKYLHVYEGYAQRFQKSLIMCRPCHNIAVEKIRNPQFIHELRDAMRLRQQREFSNIESDSGIRYGVRGIPQPSLTPFDLNTRSATRAGSEAAR